MLHSLFVTFVWMFSSFSSFDLVALIKYLVLIFCAMQVIQAREIYDEQLPFISKVLSAAIVGVLDFMME